MSFTLVLKKIPHRMDIAFLTSTPRKSKLFGTSFTPTAQCIWQNFFNSKHTFFSSSVVFSVPWLASDNARFPDATRERDSSVGRAWSIRWNFFLLFILICLHHSRCSLGFSSVGKFNGTPQTLSIQSFGSSRWLSLAYGTREPNGGLRWLRLIYANWKS